MSAKPKILDKYTKNYDNIRHFLRLVSYGCYQRSYFKNLGISARTYDDYLRQLRFFLPPAHLQESRLNGRHQHVTFRGDMYQGCDNYLIYSFRIKSLLPAYCRYTITMLQIICQSEHPLCQQEIFNQCNDAFIRYDLADHTFNENDNESSLHRRLSELTDMGLIQRLPVPGKKNIFQYQKATNPLKNLTEKEARILYAAVQFYKNVALLSVPGYYLEDTLKTMYPLSKPETMNYQFLNNSFVRVLDEEIIFSALQCIASHKLLTCKIRNTHKMVFPISIKTEYSYNRQYLQIQQPHPHQQVHTESIRIEHITDAKIGKTHVTMQQSPPKEAHRQNVRIRLNYTFPHEQTWLLREINEKNLQAVIHTQTDHSFLCDITLFDPQTLLPWLRTLHPYVEILPSTQHNLRQRMQSDIEEVLHNYEII